MKPTTQCNFFIKVEHDGNEYTDVGDIQYVHIRVVILKFSSDHTLYNSSFSVFRAHSKPGNQTRMCKYYHNHNFNIGFVWV